MEVGDNVPPSQWRRSRQYHHRHCPHPPAAQRRCRDYGPGVTLCCLGSSRCVSVPSWHLPWRVRQSPQEAINMDYSRTVARKNHWQSYLNCCEMNCVWHTTHSGIYGREVDVFFSTTPFNRCNQRIIVCSVVHHKCDDLYPTILLWHRCK
jgi:hypothetical protein